MRSKQLWKELFSVSWPGLLAFGVLYGFVLVSGGQFIAISRDYAMASLDRNILAADYLGTLLNAHTQPPLVNAIFGLTDRFFPPFSLMAVYGTLGALMVFGVAATLQLTGLRSDVCRIAGVFIALLPTSVLYSFFPNTTIPVSFFAVMTLLGLAASRKYLTWGTLVSALGVMGLFWTRASFTWFFAFAWFGLLAIFVFRAPKNQPKVAALVVLATLFGLVGATQIHYLVRFGTPTLSSWAGENLVNALRSGGLTEEQRRALAIGDQCKEQMLILGPFQPAANYTACVSSRSPLVTGHPILDQEYNGDPTYTLNFNYGARLSLAPVWSELAWEAISRYPASLWRVAWGNAERPGSISIFLSRGEDHYAVFDEIRSRTSVLWNTLGVISALTPALGWIAVLITWVAALIPQVRRRMALNRVFWAGSALLLGHAAVSILGEYGENNRFRAEFDGVLVILATLGIVALTRAWALLRDESNITEGRK